jgi:hypothetical protein
MSTEDITPAGAAASSRLLPSKRLLAPLDRDSIYWSRERWRIVAQRLGPMSVQYLLIDSHHDEIVATYSTMSNAMAHRDRLLGRTAELPAWAASKCEELAHG